MKYYPLSRVVTGLKSSGDDLTLNGLPYTGPYYKTFDGQHYTGNDPVTGKSEPLIRVVSSFDPGSMNQSSESYLSYNAAGISKFVTINPYYPQPTSMDYGRGFFFRYFAKKRNEVGNLIETSKKVYDSLQYIESPYNYELYHCIQLYWQLTGPLQDTVNTTTGIRTSGIENTNQRLVEMKEKDFKGLKTFIGENYSKFAKPVA